MLSALKLPEGVEIPILAQGEDRDQAVVSVTEAKVIDIEPEEEEVEGEEGEEGEEEGEAKEGAEADGAKDGEKQADTPAEDAKSSDDQK